MRNPRPGLLFSVLVLGMFGCKGPQHDAKEKYYLVSANIQLPYWKTAASGFYRAAKEMNMPVEVVGPTSYDPQAEAEEFRKTVSKNPTGILVSAADAELLRPEIDAAIAKGIPVIAMDADSPNSKRLFFVGTNNYAAGVTGGEAAAKFLHGKGNVVFYTMPGQKNLDERLEGYKSVFSRHPGIKISEVFDIHGDATKAFDHTDELINKKAPVNAFICLEASAGKEVATVLSNHQLNDKVVMAMDTDASTLEWLQKGLIEATIAQKPWTMSYVGLKMLDRLHHEKLESLTRDWAKDSHSPVPAIIDTGHLLIDKGNVADFVAANKDEK
jgi:ribose transport system substrate-binding protein